MSDDAMPLAQRARAMLDAGAAPETVFAGLAEATSVTEVRVIAEAVSTALGISGEEFERRRAKDRLEELEPLDPLVPDYAEEMGMLLEFGGVFDVPRVRADWTRASTLPRSPPWSGRGGPAGPPHPFPPRTGSICSRSRTCSRRATTSDSSPACSGAGSGSRNSPRTRPRASRAE